ncbi:MAG TPA: hypothetical protein VE994_17765 [Terriglobales bacterium]|nr:hypothetical protein [Terriglobales bacterium]
MSTKTQFANREEVGTHSGSQQRVTVVTAATYKGFQNDRGGNYADPVHGSTRAFGVPGDWGAVVWGGDIGIATTREDGEARDVGAEYDTRTG